MSYTVLARRYRSRDFDEIVGQEAIARTLKNAVASGRAAHAYLFCGTRGVGKTSMARILAKALNVTGDLAQGQEIADAIFRGEDLDVIEIDGASNRGVQDARDLIAGAGLSPTRCPFKIYIIDEVHMLTPEAFNTLLKTMEEPPAHVKFILCTTLPHKVPATIQSRCQRFDFRPLPASRMAAHLGDILGQEGVEADAEVLMQVARLGNGSMRDALSLLDRLLAAGEPRLTSALLEQLLGVPDQALVHGVMDAVIAHDGRAALERSARLLEHGTTVTEALELLTEHLRTLLLVAVCGPETDLIDASPDVRQVAARHAAAFDAAGLVHLMVLCDSVARNARGSATARAIFDATIVRLCVAEHLADIPHLLSGAGGGPAAPPIATRAVEPKKKAAGPEPEPASPARPQPGPPAGASVTEPKPAPSLEGADLWDAVVRFAQGSHSDQARIEHLRFESAQGQTLRLAVAEDADERLARFLGTQTAQLADLVSRAVGRRMRVEVAGSANAAPAPAAPTDLRERVRHIPAVAAAIDLFDAVVVDVRPMEG
jgi:DNA polymerase-3 subunit gamma/tau